MKRWEEINTEVRNYQRAKMARSEVVSQNRSRQFRRLPRLEVPKLPNPPMIVSIEDDGNFEGTYPTDNVEEAIAAYLASHQDRDRHKISGKLVPAA